MLKNLKKDIKTRFVVFENIAKLLIRRKRRNNFIFLPRHFDSVHEIANKYRLNLELINTKILERLNKRFHSVDLIEFCLDNKYSRSVKDLRFYEVKTKAYRDDNWKKNKLKYELCVSSEETYRFLKDKGFGVFLASFVLFEDWRYSFNIHQFDLNKVRVYTRFKKD